MNNTNLSAYSNKWYKKEIGASTLKQFVWYFFNVFFLKSSFFPSSGFKALLCRLFGARIGKSVIIKPCVNIKYPWKLVIGDNVWIGENVWIDNLAPVKIGSNCCLSQGALLLTGNHDYSKNTFDLLVKPITLESGVWIGAKAVVCPGVHCGSHAVLTAGSIATKNLDAFTIYQGNPAIRVRQRIINA